MNRTTIRWLAKWGLGIVPVVAGCAPLPEVSTVGPPPKQGDGGIVVAESHMLLKGPALKTGEPVNDCAGPGMGVAVQGSLINNKYQYDANGEPCTLAELLFDGGTQVGQRPADPGITLSFYDNLSLARPSPSAKRAQPERLAAIPPIQVQSELLDIKPLSPLEGGGRIASPAPLVLDMRTPAKPRDAAVAKAKAGPQPAPDPLVATLTGWQRKPATGPVAEADAAALRQIDKLGKGVLPQSEEDTLAQLSSSLRERERQIEEERRRHAQTQGYEEESGARGAIARQEWQQREGELQKQLDENRRRLDQLEQLAQRLKDEKDQKEKAYQKKISSLSADLQAAQAQADASRRQLILQAAAKIAEAEQIAKAARMQEQDMKLREAARMQEEAEGMMDRALSGGSKIAMAGVSGSVPSNLGPLLLSETPVVLHAKNQSLEDLLATVLKQAEPRAGVWKADWQLSPQAQRLLKEKWSLTAEASVQQVLAQITQQVQAKHGFKLSFTQFNKSRLLVVTDGTPADAE